VNRVTEALAKLHVKWQPDVTRRGPVPLAYLYDVLDVNTVSLPELSLASVAEHLIRDGIVNGAASVEDMLEDKSPIEGLCFRLGEYATCFVGTEKPLARRRFTAAHELGHALMHSSDMFRYLADTTIDEEDKTAHAEMEKEANRFAAELLMPRAVVLARVDELRKSYGRAPRAALEYRLAGELLVSGEAIRNRLHTLRIGDE
jgi:IrrE N-terminal-like domain